MTKISTRLLMLSCVLATTAWVAAPVHAQSQSQTVNTTSTADAGRSNTTPSGQAAGQVMTPPPAATPPTASTIASAMAQQEQQNIIMKYNKKEKESMFYGVEIPQRLFNNVKSNW